MLEVVLEIVARDAVMGRPLRVHARQIGIANEDHVNDSLLDPWHGTCAACNRRNVRAALITRARARARRGRLIIFIRSLASPSRSTVGSTRRRSPF